MTLITSHQLDPNSTFVNVPSVTVALAADAALCAALAAHRVLLPYPVICCRLLCFLKFVTPLESDTGGLPQLSDTVTVASATDAHLTRSTRSSSHALYEILISRSLRDPHLTRFTRSSSHVVHAPSTQCLYDMALPSAQHKFIRMARPPCVLILAPVLLYVTRKMCLVC